MSERHGDDRLRGVQGSGDLYRALVHTLPDVVLVIDEETGRYVVVNPAAERLFGYSGDELLELGPSDLLAPEEAPLLDDVLRGIRASGHWRGRLVGRRRDGSTVALEGVAAYLSVDGRGLFQGVFRDVTDRLRAEAAERERARLEGALLAARTAQHELNNQLAMIVGYAEILDAGREALPAETREVVAMIQEAAAEAAATVDALRRIARLEEVDRGGPGPVLDLGRSTGEG